MSLEFKLIIRVLKKQWCCGTNLDTYDISDEKKEENILKCIYKDTLYT